MTSSMRVIIFDNKSEKAWMVPAVVVLLYASLSLIKKEYHQFKDESGNTVELNYSSVIELSLDQSFLLLIALKLRLPV